MVLLTMTPSIVEALATAEAPETPQIEDHDSEAKSKEPSQSSKEPSLEDPELGKPISHGQIVELWKRLKAQSNANYTLEQLLRGASVYIPPPPPKPEPVSRSMKLRASHANHALVTPVQSPYGPSPPRRRSPLLRTNDQPRPATRNLQRPLPLQRRRLCRGEPPYISRRYRRRGHRDGRSAQTSHVDH